MALNQAYFPSANGVPIVPNQPTTAGTEWASKKSHKALGRMLFSKIKPKPKMKVSGKKKGKRGLTGKSPFADSNAGITYKKLFR